MNNIYYQLSPKVGVEKSLHTSECASLKGFVVRLNGTIMNVCLLLTCMQTLHIESSCVYLSITDFMVVGLIWASGRCHVPDSEIVGDFGVDIGLAVNGALGAEEAGGFIDAIIGSVIIGSVISALESELSHFLYVSFSFLVVDDRSVVAGTMIYVPLISLPARLQDDGEVIEYFLFQNIVVCPPKSNWLIDRRESQKVRVWRASTS